MNYAYLLSRLPNEVRLRIEREAAWAPWLHKGVPIEELLTDIKVMASMSSRLNRSERKVLLIIVTQFGCEPFDLPKLERMAAAELSGAEVKAGFFGLLQKALVFAFRKTWGEHVYVLPEDGLRVWQRILFSEMQSVEEPAIQASLSSGMTLSQELFFLLVQAAQQGLKLTKHGTLHKKQLQKLTESLSMPENWLKGAPLKYAFADVYPLPLAIALDLLLRLQLIEPGEDELCLHHERCGQWLRLRAEDQLAFLYSTWKSLAQPASSALQHSILLLERLPQGSWISWNALTAWLSNNGIGIELPLSELEETWNHQWVLPLIAFGWLEQGTDSTGERYYRWIHHPVQPMAAKESPAQAPQQPEPAGIMVQPDFDLLVPPDVPQHVVWEIACFADCKARDQLSVYKISKESLRRALENGRTGEELLLFLEAHAMYGVPDNVRVTIDQWTKPFGKVGFEQALLLRCADSATADALQRLNGTTGLLGERLGEQHFLIRPDALKSLSSVLEKAGFMPGKPVMLDGTGERSGGTYPSFLQSDTDSSFDQGRQPWPVSEKGLIYSRHNVMYFEMERKLPELAELYPDLHHIPPMWLKDYRSYHPSTRKEIVEKAIEWKTMLQVRRNGADYWVAPRKVQETRGTWSMTGRGRLPNDGAAEAGGTDEIQWLAEEWQEMKLILPGINDKF